MVSDDEDIGSRHIPKVPQNQAWFKPLSEEDRPATPKPAWSIPSSSLPVPINNWASALASSYKSPAENSLLSQTGDIGVFIDWFCKKQGITELTPEHLEGPVYEVVKAFHPDVIHLQFQMEECHKLLTNQVDKGLLRYNVSRPLPLGGPPGQFKIQTEFFFNKEERHHKLLSKLSYIVALKLFDILNKKYMGSNNSDGGNTGDGVKIAGGVIESGGGIGCGILSSKAVVRYQWLEEKASSILEVG
ncbi:hypothetical protein Tco_1379264 [Tanacetum coccineum]